MAPAPTPNHQRILLRLVRRFADFVEGHDLGEVFVSPIDVHLSDHDVPQPDLAFVSKERAAIVGEQEIEGAPDLAAEVLSPSTGYYDLRGKKRLYERAGVQEYWIVDPEEGSIEVHVREGGRFTLHQRAEAADQAVTSKLLDGLRVELDALL